ncbi:hypothetical protein [Thermosporothrix hazakensis]|uniref:hypothetical protein n=1 Tax=Thermosporothrix hazakensis TaxID=644383 RepID=UPI0011B5B072|nr:hypothetical protein [Thermosporothrix hazakensis]
MSTISAQNQRHGVPDAFGQQLVKSKRTPDRSQPAPEKVIGLRQGRISGYTKVPSAPVHVESGRWVRSVQGKPSPDLDEAAITRASGVVRRRAVLSLPSPRRQAVGLYKR